MVRVLYDQRCKGARQIGQGPRQKVGWLQSKTSEALLIRIGKIVAYEPEWVTGTYDRGILGSERVIIFHKSMVDNSRHAAMNCCLDYVQLRWVMSGGARDGSDRSG